MTIAIAVVGGLAILLSIIGFDWPDTPTVLLRLSTICLIIVLFVLALVK